MDVPARIEVEGGRELVLTWSDGTTTTLSALMLRANCHCATCLGPEGIPSGAGNAGDVRILDTTLVGAYALNFTFSPDHHHTGIYPFDRLRALGAAGGGAA